MCRACMCCESQFKLINERYNTPQEGWTVKLSVETVKLAGIKENPCVWNIPLSCRWTKSASPDKCVHRAAMNLKYKCLRWIRRQFEAISTQTTNHLKGEKYTNRGFSGLPTQWERFTFAWYAIPACSAWISSEMVIQGNVSSSKGVQQIYSRDLQQAACAPRTTRESASDSQRPAHTDRWSQHEIPCRQTVTDRSPDESKFLRHTGRGHPNPQFGLIRWSVWNDATAS